MVLVVVTVTVGVGVGVGVGASTVVAVVFDVTVTVCEKATGILFKFFSVLGVVTDVVVVAFTDFVGVSLFVPKVLLFKPSPLFAFLTFVMVVVV